MLPIQIEQQQQQQVTARWEKNKANRELLKIASKTITWWNYNAMRNEEELINRQQTATMEMVTKIHNTHAKEKNNMETDVWMLSK